MAIEEDEFERLYREATSINTNPSYGGGQLPTFEGQGSGFPYIVPSNYDVYSPSPDSVPYQPPVLEDVTLPRGPQTVQSETPNNPFLRNLGGQVEQGMGRAPVNSNMVNQNRPAQGILGTTAPTEYQIGSTNMRQVNSPTNYQNPFLKSFTGDQPIKADQYAQDIAVPGMIGSAFEMRPQTGSDAMRSSVSSPLPQRPEVSMSGDAGQRQSGGSKPDSVFGKNILSDISNAMAPLARKVASAKGLMSMDNNPSIDQSMGAASSSEQPSTASNFSGQYTNDQALAAQALRGGNPTVSPSSASDTMAQFRQAVGVDTNTDQGFKVDGPDDNVPAPIIEKSSQFIKETQEAEAKQPGWFARKLQDPTFFAKAAIAFNTMRLNPDQALTAAMTQRIKDIRETQTASRTADWLTKNNFPNLAAAVSNKSLSGSDAMKLALARGSKQLVTPEKYQELFGTEIPEKYKGSILIYDSMTGDLSQVGGGGITIDQRGEGKEAEIKATNFGKRMENYQEAGENATNALLTIRHMQRLNETGNIDEVPAWIRETLPLWAQNDDTQMYQALLNGLAQTQRVSGTGSQSDRDVELLMQKVGSIGANVAARKYALKALERQAELNAARADIAGQWSIGRLTKEQALDKLKEVENQSLFTDEERELISSLETKGLDAPTSKSKDGEKDIFAGVPEDIVKQIKGDKETLELFKNATPERRKRFIDSFRDNNREKTIFDGDVGA